MTTTDLHTTVERRLRRAGQRYTPGRRDLVRLLDDAASPMTVDELLDADHGLSPSSVYRNLRTLEHAGVARRLRTANSSGARLELAEGLTSHHHHLVCNHCGSVEDVPPTSELERALRGLTHRVGREQRFETEHHRLDLVGTCADCTG